MLDGARFKAGELTRHWRIVAGVFLGLVFSIGTFGTYTFGVVSIALSEEFGWSRSQTLLGFTAHNIGIVLGAPLAGILADRYDERGFLIMSTLVFAGLWASLATLSGALVQFYITMLAIPLLAGGCLPLVYSKFIVMWFDRSRGLALGLGLSGVGVGAALVPPAFQLLADGQGWRFAILATAGAIAIVPAIAAILFLRVRPAHLPAERSPTKASSSRQHGLAAVIMSRAMACILLFALMTGVALTAGVVSLPSILSDSSIHQSLIAAALSVLGVSAIAGRIVGGLLLDRFEARWVVFFIMLGPSLSFVLLSLQPMHWQTIVLAVALLGFALGAEIDVVGYIISRQFDFENFGRLYGLVFGAFVLGGSIGPVLLGFTRDTLGTYSHGLIGLSGLVILSAFVILLLPKNPETKLEGRLEEAEGLRSDKKRPT